MNFINKYLNRISLTKKLLIIFFGCVCIPFALQFIFYFSQTEKNIQEELYQKMENTLEDRAKAIEASLSDTLRVSVKYNNDVRLYRFIDKNYKSDIEYLVDYQEIVNQIIKSDLPYHMQIDNVSFYTDNPTIFNGALIHQKIPLDGKMLESGGIEQESFPIEGSDEALRFNVGMKYIPQERMFQRSMTFVRRMNYYPEYKEHQKLLRIELSISYFNSMLSDTGMFSNLVLADDSNRILFSSNTYSKNGPFEYLDEAGSEKGIIVMERDIRGLPMTIYGYYDSNIISDQFKSSITGMLVIMIISLAIAASCILIIGNNISKRTQQIVEKAEQISKGDFSGELATMSESGNDEIARIEKSINEMNELLQEYIEREFNTKLEKSQMEKETVQAKLMALQSQVNPHFLFNALESIRLNALDKDSAETANMIKHMSKIFRYLVDWNGDIIQLQEELLFLDEFLTIQKFRFGAEFNHSIHIDEAARACLVPKLILQPLVENACIHGIEASSNDKNIKITVTVQDDKVTMTVEDNGGGVAGSKLKRLKEMLRGGPPVGNSVGLYNVYQRLSLHYKDDFSFEINSELGKGTMCRVQIPLQYQ